MISPCFLAFTIRTITTNNIIWRKIFCVECGLEKEKKNQIQWSPWTSITTFLTSNNQNHYIDITMNSIISLIMSWKVYFLELIINIVLFLLSQWQLLVDFIDFLWSDRVEFLVVARLEHPAVLDPSEPGQRSGEASQDQIKTVLIGKVDVMGYD